ncbi:MAG: acetylesterase, partial [Lachnospiraceae bacterium]|nr:acetylesterase [Lachnospiraceae bacterium]
PEYLMKELVKEHEKNPGVLLPKFYLSCGTKDPLMRLNKPFKDNLIELGYDVTWNEADYGHEWPFWEQELGHLLEWLPVK